MSDHSPDPVSPNPATADRVASGPSSSGAVPTGDGTDVTTAAGPASRLDGLEADVAAVASAIDALDRIVADGPGGHHSAAEIAAVVSPERFRDDSDEAAAS